MSAWLGNVGWRRAPLMGPVAGAVTVLATLLAARWWALSYSPGLFGDEWRPYLVPSLGWIAAGLAALACGRSTMRQMPAASSATVFGIAVLVGLFLVAVQILLGIVSGFGRSPYSQEPKWLFLNLVFAGALLFGIEAARTALLRLLPGRPTLVLLMVTLGLATVQFTDHQLTPSGFDQQAHFWGATFIPVAALGLLSGFFVTQGGLSAALLVTTPLMLFNIYSPALPIGDWPVLALVGVAGPAVGLWLAEGILTEGAHTESGGRSRLPSIAWVGTAVIALTIFWFSFGFFGYRPMFVPSHSMEPVIRQGDIVLVGPVSPGDVKVGDIILYQVSPQQRVLHRVADIQQDPRTGGRVFVFKGDNNNTADALPIGDNQIKGRYLGRVPMLGWVPIKVSHFLGFLR